MKNLDAYFLLENLPMEVKKVNGFRSESRLDCTLFAGVYQGLDMFKNPKGMIYLYPTETSDFIECNGKRMATKALTNGTLNLSSLYVENFEHPTFAYGYPNPNKQTESGKLNPLYEYRHDGYLFKKNADLTRIEVYVIIGGRNLIKEAFSRFLDGDFDLEMEQLRNEAKPFYPYKGSYLTDTVNS